MELVRQYLSPNVVEIFGIAAIGYLFIYKPLKLLLSWASNKVCSGCRSSRILKAGPNDYAVITGSTDGIGLEYARQLADKGFQLLLLSRTEEKLKRVASEILQQYPQAKKVETLAVDFTRTDIYDAIKQKLESLNGQIYILVNNVGTMHPIPELFADYPQGSHLKVINTNIVSFTSMSEMVIPIMLKQKTCPHAKRPKGVIINISSGVAQIEIPYFSIYGATKAYMSYLSKVMTAEYKDQGIVVQTVTPNQVVTNMSREFHEPAVAVPADEYVRYALKAVGTESMTNAHPKHKLYNNIFVLAQDYICEGWFMKMMLSAMRKKSLELKEKNKNN